MKRYGLCLVVFLVFFTSFVDKSNAGVILDIETSSDGATEFILQDSVNIILDQYIDTVNSCSFFFSVRLCINMMSFIVEGYKFYEKIWPEAFEKMKLERLGQVMQCNRNYSKGIKNCIAVGNIVSDWRKLTFNIYYDGIANVRKSFLKVGMEYVVPIKGFDNSNLEKASIYYQKDVYLQPEVCAAYGYHDVNYHGSVSISVPINAMRVYLISSGSNLELEKKEDCEDEYCFRDEYTVYVRSEMSFSRYPDAACWTLQRIKQRIKQGDLKKRDTAQSQ